jgi:twitching motility protein PilT
VPAVEVLMSTPRVIELIADPTRAEGSLEQAIAEGEYYGMQTFDQALLQHVQAGRVAMEEAVQAASSPHDFKLLVAGDGRTSTSMSDLQNDRHHDEAPPSAGPAHATAAVPHEPVPAGSPHAPAAPAGHAVPPSPAPALSSANGRPSAPPPGFGG